MTYALAEAPAFLLRDKASSFYPTGTSIVKLLGDHL